MAIEENSAQPTAASFQFAMPGGAEWMKSFSQLPTTLFVSRWKDALGHRWLSGGPSRLHHEAC